MSTEEATKRRKVKFLVDSQLDQIKFQPREWLVDRLILMGKLIIFGGKPKVGKTLLATQLASSVASGEEFLDRKVKQGKVLYLALEDDLQSIQERRRKQQTPQGLPDLVWTVEWPTEKRGIESLGSFLSSNPGFVLVIVDVFTSFCGFGTDQLQAGEMRELMDLLRKIVQTHGIVILIVDHFKKGETSDIVDLVYGSVQKTAGTDQVLSLQKRRSGFVLDNQGRGLDAESLQLERVVETHTWKCIGEGIPESRTRQRVKTWLFLLLSDGPMALREIEELAKAERIGRNSLRRAADSLDVVREPLPKGLGRGDLWSLPPQ